MVKSDSTNISLSGLSWDQVGTKLAPGWHQVVSILDFCRETQSIQSIMDKAQWTNRTKFRNKYINPFLEMELIQMTIPEKPNSPKQRYHLTRKGEKLIQLITKQQ